MIIELGDGAFTIDLHPRLTVFTSLGAVEREGLVGEILGALDGTRTGVHLEIRDRHGRQYAVLRPVGAAGSVVDLGSGEDCTDPFRGDAGADKLDLRRGAALVLRVGDLVAGPAPSPLVARLARLEQRTLWRAADEVATTEHRLSEETTALAPTIARSGASDAIEERHRLLEGAIARASAAKRFALLAGSVGAVAAVPFAALRPALALPPLAVTVIAMTRAELSRRSIEEAEQEEQLALAEVGAQSYLGFHIQRVDGMLTSVDARKRVAQAAEAHRRALATWQELAPGVDHRQALAVRDEVMARALTERELARLEQDLQLGALPDEAREAIEGLLRRLDEVAKVGPLGDGLPILLDDPFRSLDDASVHAVLRVLAQRAGSPQVVVLTEDPRIEAWARVEAAGGGIGLAEPHAAPATEAEIVELPAVRQLHVVPPAAC